MSRKKEVKSFSDVADSISEIVKKPLNKEEVDKINSILKPVTRGEQIKNASRELSEVIDSYSSFISGANWADGHPQDESQLIIDLIHQRSVAFDYGREQSELLKKEQDYSLQQTQALYHTIEILKVAEKALKDMQNKNPIEFNPLHAKMTLEKIKEMRSKK